MDTQSVGNKSLTFDCDLDLVVGTKILCGTHLLILFYFTVKFDLIPFIAFLVMADTRFVTDQPLIFDCDLDLGHWKLNFVHDTPCHFGLSFCEV